MNTGTDSTVIGASEAKISGKEELLIPLREIRPYGNQPRTFFSRTAMKDLVDSIREEGQKQAGEVRPLEPPVDGHHYELIDGERRWRACILAQTGTYRALVNRQIQTEKDQFISSVMANVNRENNTPIEMARAIKRMKDEFGYSFERIGRTIGKSVLTVTNHYNLLRLEPGTLALMDPERTDDKRLKVTTAVLLVGIPADIQVTLANSIIDQGLAAESAKSLIKRTLQRSGRSNIGRPDKAFMSLLIFVTKTAERLELYLNAPNDELRTILSGGKLQERLRMFEILEELVTDFPSLKQQVIAELGGTAEEKARQQAVTVSILAGLAEKFPELQQKISTLLRERR